MGVSKNQKWRNPLPLNSNSRIHLRLRSNLLHFPRTWSRLHLRLRLLLVSISIFSCWFGLGRLQHLLNVALFLFSVGFGCVFVVFSLSGLCVFLASQCCWCWFSVFRLSFVGWLGNSPNFC